MVKVQFKKLIFHVALRILNLHYIYKKYGAKLKLPQNTDPEKLKQLIESAINNVPYFKSNLKYIHRGNDTLQSFSELTFSTQKIQVKESISDFINPALVKDKYLLNFKSPNLLKYFRLYKSNVILSMSTGGSSGSPLKFYMSKDRGLKFLAQFFAISKYLGLKEGESQMACMQGGMYQQNNMISKILPLIGIPAFIFKEINQETATKFAGHFKRHKPVTLICSPSFLSEMASQFKKKNTIINSRLKGIICIGEMLFDGQREIIESVFGAKVFNVYASNEIGIMAVECTEHNGLHILEESVILENDFSSHILATAIGSECQPFIKYNTGDIGKIEFTVCLCGITGKKITDQKGRVEEYIIDKNENKIHSSYLRQLLINSNHKFNDTIISGQFIQKKNRKIHFKLQLKENERELQILNFISQNIKLLCDLDSDGAIVDSLVPKTGKLKFFSRED